MHPKRIFKEPKEILKAFEEYKQHLEIERTKWEKVQYIGRDGNRVIDYPKLPYTYEGFKRYCRNNYGEVQHYFENTLNYYDEFCDICSRIKEEIREDQITGGLLGFYNPSITQRLNNLRENVETDIKTNGESLNNVLKIEVIKPNDESDSSI